MCGTVYSCLVYPILFAKLVDTNLPQCARPFLGSGARKSAGLVGEVHISNLKANPLGLRAMKVEPCIQALQVAKHNETRIRWKWKSLKEIHISNSSAKIGRWKYSNEFYGEVFQFSLIFAFCMSRGSNSQMGWRLMNDSHIPYFLCNFDFFVAESHSIVPFRLSRCKG